MKQDCEAADDPVLDARRIERFADAFRNFGELLQVLIVGLKQQQLYGSASPAARTVLQ